MVTQYDIDCSQDLRSLSLKTTCQTHVFICLLYAGSICTAYTRLMSCLPYSRPSIKQPGLRSIKQPGLRSIKQPGLRSTLVNCWCKADILPGGWTHIHLRPDWATVEAAEAAKCASSTRHNISLYQLNMGDTNYLIILEIRRKQKWWTLIYNCLKKRKVYLTKTYLEVYLTFCFYFSDYNYPTATKLIIILVYGTSECEKLRH